MNPPLISVILTTYNRCHLLPRAINSVLSGTYDNFELIVIDDASSDETPVVLSRLTDSRIRYVRMDKNGGVLRARNRGFDIARGDYVTMLDDDDELTPDALAAVAEEYRNAARESVDVLWFDCLDAESGTKSGSFHGSDGVIKFEEYVCGRIQGDFWLTFSRKSLQGNRFDERLKAHESLLWLRIHRTHRARHIAKSLCKKYREHGGERLCDLGVRLRQLEHTTLALSEFIEEFGNDLTRLCPSMYGKRLAYLGLHQMATDDFVSGRKSVLRSLKYRPSLKYALLYISSFVLSSRHITGIIVRTDS